MTSNVHSSELSTRGWKDDINAAYKRENGELKVNEWKLDLDTSSLAMQIELMNISNKKAMANFVKQRIQV